ncbi:protein Aster-C isoform X2 [Drosophila busckii]|uniref:protein Aster-C isoform X2 n=1 Tax=Drosophila busckii TaxID=30019 RepID=UPI00083F008B|nr:protein Aster-C isoform X2 [Drosophila busckii]
MKAIKIKLKYGLNTNPKTKSISGTSRQSSSKGSVTNYHVRKTATGNEPGTAKRPTQAETHRKESQRVTRTSRAVTFNTDVRTGNVIKDKWKLPTQRTEPASGLRGCNAAHEGQQLVNEVLRVPVDMLFDMLFSGTSKFVERLHAKRNSTDLRLGIWKVNRDGLLTRELQVTVQLQASVGPKCARVTEYYTQRSCCKPGFLYSIDVKSVNAGIPYEDAFYVAIHYCMLRTADNNTELKVFAEVKFVKSTWAVIQMFIQKHAYEGLHEYFSDLLQELLIEIASPQRQVKRHFKY